MSPVGPLRSETAAEQRLLDALPERTDAADAPSAYCAGRHDQPRWPPPCRVTAEGRRARTGRTTGSGQRAARRAVPHEADSTDRKSPSFGKRCVTFGVHPSHPSQPPATVIPSRSTHGGTHVPGRPATAAAAANTARGTAGAPAGATGPAGLGAQAHRPPGRRRRVPLRGRRRRGGGGEPEAEAGAKPAPAVTVTKTAKPKAAKPEAPAGEGEDEAPDGEAVFKVWGPRRPVWRSPMAATGRTSTATAFP